MNENTNFVAYEYKDIALKRSMAAMYIDCMKNFGWELIERNEYGILNSNPLAVQIYHERPEAPDAVILKFRRDKKMDNRRKINELEGQYEDAFKKLGKLDTKNDAKTMGISLGSGIVGAGCIALAVYGFMSSNIFLAVVFTLIGLAACAVGFFANIKFGRKNAQSSEPQKQGLMDLIYDTCEKASVL